MEENERREGVLKQHFALYAKKPSMKDCFVTVFIFMICTIIGLLFQKLHFTDTNIVTIYILGVLITSILTDGYLCSIAGSFLSVVLFCFFLTEPRMSFQTYAVGYPVTFAIMLVCSVLAGTLSAKLKMHARISSQLAFRTQVLFDTDRLLQKARSSKEMLRVTCTQLVRLLNRDIVAYIVEEGKLSQGQVFCQNKEETNQQFLIPEEQKIARWVYENNKRAGVGTNYFKNAKCLYLAIRIGDHVYGVIGIPANKDVFDSVEYSILLSVVNECALAMENLRNAIEKEKNAVLAKNEQLRADLLRAISHDLRTPLTSLRLRCEFLPDGDDRERMLQTLAQMESMLHATLSFARDEHQGEPSRQVDLVSLLHSLCDDYEDNGQPVVCLAEGKRVYQCRPEVLRRVLQNLISNALKYAGDAEVSLEETTSSVLIRVRDHGTGIPEEQLESVFKPFYRLDEARNTEDGSVGLGLSIARTLIHQHGGELRLKNMPDGGLQAEIELPA